MYEFLCPGCSTNCIGKTERTLFQRNVEHALNDKKSVVNIHFNEYNGVDHMFNITKLTLSLFSDTIVDEVQVLRKSRINLVQINTIIDLNNWNIVLFQ